MVFSFDNADEHLPHRPRGFSVPFHEDPYSPATESPVLEKLDTQNREFVNAEPTSPAGRAPFSPTFSGKPLYGGGRRRASIVAAANSEVAGLDVSALATTLHKSPVSPHAHVVNGGLSALFSCMEVDSKPGSENESGNTTEHLGRKKKKNRDRKGAQTKPASRKGKANKLQPKVAQTGKKEVNGKAIITQFPPKLAKSETKWSNEGFLSGNLTFEKYPPSAYSTPPRSLVSSDIDEPVSSVTSFSTPSSSPPRKGLLRDLLEEQRASTSDVVIVSSESGEPIESYEVALDHEFISSELRSRPVTRSASPERSPPVATEHRSNQFLSPSPPRRKVCAEDFEVLRCLGKGTYGTVLLVRHVKTGRLYAQKQLKKASIIITKKLIDQTKAERVILEAVRHPFVVKLYYAFQDHEKLYLILEYAQGGELFLHLATEKMFSEEVAAFYMASLVLALSHLHLNAGVIYRDLKPENCLLDADGFLLLTDFGLSKVKAEDSVCRSFLGTPEYMAPEVITQKEYDHAVDWWSLGALGVDLLTGSPPFTGNNNKKIADKIVKQKISLPFYLSPDAKDLLTKLLRKEPSKRLGANLERDLPAIKKHRFFRKIDWEKLERKELKPPIIPLITDPELAENFSLEFTALACSPPVKPLVAGLDAERETKEEENLFGGFSFVGSYDHGDLCK